MLQNLLKNQNSYRYDSYKTSKNIYEGVFNFGYPVPKVAKNN